MAKLWHKNYDLDALIEKFTVGDDYLLDRNLVVADCVATTAHAHMLQKIKVITTEEYDQIKNRLIELIDLFRNGRFTIRQSDEDCHTAIENYLVEKTGDVGKKIHTARSRNDQVIAALRIFSRDYLLSVKGRVLDLAEALIDFAKKHEFVPMAGRTHMQIAMPSSVGLWAGAWAEEIIDDYELLLTAYKLNDMCPLGSAASYGVPLQIDREMVASELGFGKLQNNVLYANNSRGKIESVILDAASQICLTLSKMAQDLIVFSMPEFKYFNLPAELCSGSSIMPQKKNPCGLELVRAKTATILASSHAVKEIIKALPSGYNRDFQETKGHFMRGLSIVNMSVKVMTLTLKKLSVNEQELKKGFIKEIYATDRALELVAGGMPFRDAYREVGLNLDKLNDRDPVEVIKRKTHAGTTGNLMLQKTEDGISHQRNALRSRHEMLEKAYKNLLGIIPEVISDDNLLT